MAFISKWWMALVIVSLTAVIYVPVLSFEFAWLDDYEILKGGLIIDSLGEWWSVLFNNDGNFVNYHRPLYNAMHSIDLWLWGKDPSGFHGSSLMLHLLNVILATIWLKKLELNEWLILSIVLTWALLPCNAAVVAMIHSKADLLSTLFMLVAFNTVATYRSRSQLVLFILAFLLALLSKEVAFGGLIFVALMNVWQRPLHKELLITLGVLLTLFVLFRLVGASEETTPDLVRILTFPLVYGSYFFESLPGIRLTEADTVWAVTSMKPMEVLRGSVMFISAALIQLVAWKKLPATRMFILLFNCMLLPVSQVIPTLHFRADRFLYLASLGYVGMIWSMIFSLKDQAVDRYKLSFLKHPAIWLAPVVFYCGIRLTNYLPVFRNDKSFFSYTIDQASECREAHSFIGLMAMEDVDYTRASAHFAKSLNGNPALYSFVDRSTVKANLATIAMRNGNYHDALNKFQGVSGGVQKYPQMDLNIAICYKMIGNPNKAYEHLVSYQKRFPDELKGMEKMAEVYIDLGKKREAIDEFNKILRLYPDHQNKTGIIDAIYSLGG